MLTKRTRAPKLIGDFGEGLVTYALIRKGFEVAYVDHVGADLIAKKGEDRPIAVSVKTRLFKPNSNESRMVVIDKSSLDKLDFFAELFALEPVFAQVVCLADENLIHLFMIRAADIRANFTGIKSGFSLQFSKDKVNKLKGEPWIAYCCWEAEQIGNYDFQTAASCPEKRE